MLKLATTKLLLLVAFILAQVNSECPSELKDVCLNCDINNQCTQCIIGYYVIEGKCLLCQEGCLECSSMTQCSSCISRYTLLNETCVACNSKCSTCQGEPNYCMDCIDGYKLDANHECHYRYTLILLGGGACAILVFMLLVFTLVNRCVKPRRDNESYGNVLDDETRIQQKTVMSHKADIGVTENMLDLSEVQGNPSHHFQPGNKPQSFLNPHEHEEDRRIMESLDSLKKHNQEIEAKDEHNVRK